MLNLLLEESRAPLLEHCRGGKDRTGFGTALILFALGVSKEDVLKDYMLTSTYMRKRNEKRMAEYAQFTDNEMVLKYLFSLMDTKQEYMEASFATMEKVAGSVEAYLVDIMDFDEIKQKKLQKYFLSE